MSLYKLNNDLLRLLILRIKENDFPIKLLLQNVLQPNIQVERYFFLIQYNFLYNFILSDANRIFLFECFLCHLYIYMTMF